MVFSRTSSFQNETRFKNIFRLEPGSVLTLNVDDIKIQRPYIFEYEPSDLSINNYIDDTRNTLKLALSRRLKGKDEVLFGLSGGLDSRIVLGSIKKILLEKLIATLMV